MNVENEQVMQKLEEISGNDLAVKNKQLAILQAGIDVLNDKVNQLTKENEELKAKPESNNEQEDAERH